MKVPKVTVGIVRSREKYFEECLESVQNQVYPPGIDIVVIENRDKKKSIGKCYNEIVDKAKTEWILFVGDDDILMLDYVYSMMVAGIAFYQRFEIICLSSFCTLFDKERKQTMDKLVQSLWRKNYIMENRFDETLERYVDADLYNRATEQGQKIGLNSWNYGYYYRQHDSNVTCNRLKNLNDTESTIRVKVV